MRAGVGDPAVVRGLRSVTGVLAGGLVVLAAVVVAAEVLAVQRGAEGPGALGVAAHVAAAVLAVAAQLHADRRAGAASLPGQLVVLAAAVGLLWWRWWLV